jgi:hypothetical protein
VDKFRIGFYYKEPGEVVILKDTTYFGCGFGVMLFRDAYRGENLLKYFVKYETNALYKQGISGRIIGADQPEPLKNIKKKKQAEGFTPDQLFLVLK